MRYLQATLIVLTLACCSSTGWAQSDNPFGGPRNGNSNARAADPFAAPPNQTRQQRGVPVRSARDAIVQEAKQALAAGRKPVKVASNPNEAEAKIKASLSDETSVTFIQTPLSEAMQSISAMHEIPVVVDRRALEEIGLTADAPVTISLKNVTLRSALRLMLRELDCTYIVKDEVLQITTLEAAEQNLTLEMYQLPDNLAAKSDQVIKVLTGTVVPDTWETLGGPSSAMSIDHVLVISTTSDVHARVESFLEKLIDKYGK